MNSLHSFGGLGGYKFIKDFEFHPWSGLSGILVCADATLCIVQYPIAMETQ